MAEVSCYYRKPDIFEELVRFIAKIGSSIRFHAA